MEQKIITEVFLRHLDALLNNFSDDVDAFLILSGKEEGSHKPKTKAMFIWLFGYDMIETIFVVTKKSLIYLASTKKLQMMDEIKTKLPSKLTFHLLQKQASNKEQFQKMINIIKQDSPKQSLNILTLTKEKQAGPLNQEWNEFLQSVNANCMDSVSQVQELLAHKDDQELSFVQQSAQLTTRLTKKLISSIENAIDVGTKIKHSELANKMESLLENPQEKAKIIKEFNLQDGLYDLSFTPIIQSGGSYSLLPSATSSNQYLSSDVILLTLGTQVNEYNTAAVRSLFINPTESQKKLYNQLLETQNKAIQLMAAGVKLCEVYEQTKQFFQTLGTSVDFPLVIGYGIGLEFREQLLAIQEGNERVIKAKEVYLVQVSVENISGGQKGINYTISIGDVIMISGSGNSVLTQGIPKLYKSISYQLQDEDEVQEEQKQTNTNRDQQQQAQQKTRGPRNQQILIQRQNEQQRQKHQEELAKRKQIELEERLSKDQFAKDYNQNKSLELDKLQCYRAPEQLPREAKKGQIFIDHQKNSLLVPYQGTHIPFHVSCIKNVSKIDEGSMGASIRINFFTTETSAGNIQFPTVDEKSVFIKELQYRSKTVVRLQDLINQIKTLQKRVKAEQQVEREKQHTGDLEQLVLNRGGRKPVFKDLKIRPTVGQGKGAGQLEVHTNGFRYISTNKENVDIVFKNIKHYVYQSPEHEIIAAIHFHLYSPIILGKKKTHDVQFYCEVGGGVEHLEGRRKHNRNDEDEIEDEERARVQRKKMAREFEAFIKSIEEVAKDYKIVFEKPYRELGFEGNWNRARIFLQPTLNTLMYIIESPFFILTLQECEIACLERILPGIKSFDLVFIFKNYEKPVLRVESIDIKDLEAVKNWLDRMNILFFEVAQNLVWKNVLGQIQKDITGFVEDGGWQTILGDSDDEAGGSDQEEIEEGDSEFNPQQSDDDDDDDYSEDIDEEDDDHDDGDLNESDDDDDDEISDVIDLENLSEEDEQEVSDHNSDRHKKHSSNMGKNQQKSNGNRNKPQQQQQQQQKKRIPTRK